jgi:hypothetical protein
MLVMLVNGNYALSTLIIMTYYSYGTDTGSTSKAVAHSLASSLLVVLRALAGRLIQIPHASK